MDKVKINNQVVLMRKFVKQARTRIINKCVKEHKLLKDRKGNEDQVLKCKRKAERLLLKIAILKKFKPDAVSKMALSKAKDWKAILSQADVSLEDRCLAMLASYAPIQNEVEKFHSLNSHLVPKIPILIQEWEEKAKQSQSSPRSFKKDMKAGKETNPTANDSPYKPEKKLEVRETQQESSLLANVSKQLQIVKSKLKKADGDASDSAYKDTEESEENESGSDREKALKASSQTRHRISRKANKKIKTSLNPNDADSTLESENEEVEDCSRSSQSDLDSDDGTKEAQELESQHERKAVALMDSFEDGDATSEESEEDETCPESDKPTASQNRFKFFEKDDKRLENNLSSRSTDSPMESEDERVEDSSKSSQKDIESGNVTKKQVLESKLKPRINNADNPTIATIRTSATKPVQSQKSFAVKSNSTKAVALLNLNEMLDIDEIPIENTNGDIGTTQESSKRKKDNFFLNDSGDVSESDADEDLEDGRRQRTHSPFRKKPYKDFKKKDSSKDNFKRDRRYNGTESSLDNFRNKKFSSISPRNPQSDLRENSFRKSNRHYHPKDKFNNAEKNRGRQGDELYKNRSSNTGGRQANDFNRNKEFNKINKKDGSDPRPFKSFAGQNFKKNLFNHSSTNDHNPRNKSDHFNKTAKKDDLPLHPSWEAKRKVKDLVKAKFQGKRVVFKD